MQSVDIGANTYPALATIDEADSYLEADFNASTWLAADSDTKGRALVTATRIFQRQSWKPTVDLEAAPLAIVNGSIELASQIVSGYDASNQQTTASLIKRQKAGSVEQEFFAPGAISGTSGSRFPLPVWELIADYLASGTAGETFLAGSYSTGVCGESLAEINYGVTTGGYGPDRL